LDSCAEATAILLPNHRLQLTGCARDMMLLSVWSLLSAGGRQLSLLRYAPKPESLHKVDAVLASAAVGPCSLGMDFHRPLPID
jgi:hypothetical protein